MKHLFLFLTLATAVGGCAAMVRTWQFTPAATVETETVRVEVTRAAVKQKVAHVALRLTNRAARPVRVEVGTLTLTLPDGTTVRGKTSLLGRAARGARGLLSRVGIGRRAEVPEVPPGGSLEARVAFRASRRDLRRHGELRVDLSGIRVDAEALRARPLVLRAPARAPRGEQI
jgi:hypothetical protein